MTIEIVSFRNYKKNTLQGFLTIRLTNVGLEIRDATLHERGGERWVGLPSKPYEAEGETKYSYIVKFYEKAKYHQFQKAALEALDEYMQTNREDAQETDVPF